MSGCKAKILHELNTILEDDERMADMLAHELGMHLERYISTLSCSGDCGCSPKPATE